MIQQKTILQGHLHFGNEKSFNLSRQMFEGRVETYYKNELAFNEPDLFDELNFSFEVPRTVVAVTEKNWKNTVDAMHFLAQYAMCGYLEAYQTDAGSILQKEVVIPNNDKQPVRDYWKAHHLFEQGNLEDAKMALDFSMNGFKYHTQALELYGRLEFLFNNIPSSIDYFTRALKTYPRSYTAFFNRGLAFNAVNEFEKAVADFDNAIKHSLAILDIHWRARLEKARGLIELGSHETARKELAFYVQKQFQEDSENHARKREAYLLGADSFLDTASFDTAIECVEKAIQHGAGESIISTAACIFKRGVIKKASGVEGFDLDLIKASEMGYAHAEKVK
jgi:tetratricopeptide (TPR) repeat protein